MIEEPGQSFKALTKIHVTPKYTVPLRRNLTGNANANGYRTDTERVREREWNRYRTDTERISNGYRTDTEQ